MKIVDNGEVINIDEKDVSVKDVLETFGKPLNIPMKFLMMIDEEKHLVIDDWNISNVLSEDAEVIINWHSRQ